MKIMLILGCWGRDDGTFCTCGGVSNQILDMSIKTEQMRKVADYLDTLQLYDKPLYNNVHTILFNIQDRFSEVGKPIFQKAYFLKMEEFCILHSKCGLYLRLEMIEREKK